MHETVVAQSVLATILAESEKHNGRPVGARISCGTFSAVNDELLKLSFEAIAKDTLCKDTQLQIEHKDIRGKCDKCRNIFTVLLQKPRCPKCGGQKFALLPDAPIILEQIEFETE